METCYRLFLLRKSVYFAFDNTTKTFTSLKTKDKTVAAPPPDCASRRAGIHEGHDSACKRANAVN